MTPVRMPKWGLSMQEGTIVEWHRRVGDRVTEGDDLVDVETSKITNVAEAPSAGLIRRIVAGPGETLPVGALMAVLAEPEVADAELDAFVADFQSRFAVEGAAEGEGDALRLALVPVGGGRALRIGQAGGDAGRPVVLLHGFSGDLNNWLFNIQALAVRAPVVAVDLPGHGGSTKDVGDGSLDALARDVAALFEALAIDDVVLVGHSLGCAVAMRLAATRPELVHRLVLIAPAYLPGGKIDAEFVDGVVEAQRARALKPVLERLVADPAAISRDMVDDMLKFKRLDGAEEALGALRDRMLAGDDARALAADLDKLPPTHVIASRTDVIVGAPDPERLPPGWRVSWIEGAGHLPHLEKAAEVNALLIAQP